MANTDWSDLKFVVDSELNITGRLPSVKPVIQDLKPILTSRHACLTSRNACLCPAPITPARTLQECRMFLARRSTAKLVRTRVGERIFIF